MGEDLKKANKALAKTQESLDKAQRPIDQGSPELDGEVQEIVLENYKSDYFYYFYDENKLQHIYSKSYDEHRNKLLEYRQTK